MSENAKFVYRNQVITFLRLHSAQLTDLHMNNITSYFYLDDHVQIRHAVNYDTV